MRKIIINIPDDTKLISLSLVTVESDGNIGLKTVGITTQDILNGNEIDVIFEED